MNARSMKTHYPKDYTDHGAESTATFQPRTIDIDGRPTLMVQAGFTSSNLLARSIEEAEQGTGLICLVVARPGEIALGFTMTTERTRLVAAALNRMAERSEKSAAQAAAVALKKAAGK